VIESAEEFVRLRSSEDPAEYRRAAWEEAPLEVWYEVIERFPDMREWVAHNKTVPMEILRVLVRDPDVRVRDTVARKNKLDEPLLRLLAKDPDEGVRLAIAGHKKAPEGLLREMLGDPWGNINELIQERLGEFEPEGGQRREERG
jgi:hypothetical protein